MLQACALKRTFGEKTAVNGVSFDVPEGRMVGFVGGNGAGKTTTMRMLMGVLEPDSGEVLFDGHPVSADERARFGYMPEERGLYPKQTLSGQLTFIGEMKGMDRRRAREEAGELLERFGLGARKTDLLESLSLGNQQRVQIIAAVMGDPLCLILDEPFSGLDPEAIDEMALALRDLTARGVPVLFSSHQLDLVDRLCDEIIVLAKGEVVASGTNDELRASAPPDYRLVSTGGTDWVGAWPGAEMLGAPAPASEGALVRLADDDTAPHFLAEAVRRGEVREFARLRPSLSEIYQEVTQ